MTLPFFRERFPGDGEDVASGDDNSDDVDEDDDDVGFEDDGIDGLEDDFDEGSDGTRYVL